MAITTVAGAISGMQYTREFVKAVTGTLVAGRPQSLLYLAGSPAAGVAPTPGLKGAALTSYGGQIPFTNPTSGNTYVARLQAAAPQGGTLLLCDRLWHNSGYTITSTGAQVIGNTITSSSVANPTVITTSANHPFANGDVVNIQGHTGSTPAVSGSYTISNVTATSFTVPVNVTGGGTGGTVGLAQPARDMNGAIAGEGVFLGVEVSGAAGAAAPTLTISYTNSAGTGAKTGTNIVATANSPTQGTFYPIGLAAGDTGVQTVQSLTLSASWISGTLSLVAYRVLARLEITLANSPNAADALTAGFARAYDNTVPFLIFIPQTTTSSNIAGHVIWTQG